MTTQCLLHLQYLVREVFCFVFGLWN